MNCLLCTLSTRLKLSISLLCQPVLPRMPAPTASTMAAAIVAVVLLKGMRSVVIVRLSCTYYTPLKAPAHKNFIVCPACVCAHRCRNLSVHYSSWSCTTYCCLSPAFDRTACGAFKLHFPHSAFLCRALVLIRVILVAFHMRFIASSIFQQYFLLLLNTALLELIFTMCVRDFCSQTPTVSPPALLPAALRLLLLPLHFVFSYCASIFHPICIWAFVVVVRKVVPSCAVKDNDNIVTFRFIMVSSLSERWHKFWANVLFWFVFLPL